MGGLPFDALSLSSPSRFLVHFDLFVPCFTDPQHGANKVIMHVRRESLGVQFLAASGVGNLFGGEFMSALQRCHGCSLLSF